MAQPSDTKIESKRSHLNGSGGAAGGADGWCSHPTGTLHYAFGGH